MIEHPDVNYLLVCFSLNEPTVSQFPVGVDLLNMKYMLSIETFKGFILGGWRPRGEVEHRTTLFF